MFYETIHEMALQNNSIAITDALKEIRELKINFVKSLIPDFTINFNFKNEEICKDFLEHMNIKPSEKYFSINVKNIISFDDEELLNYYLKQEIKSDLMTAHLATLKAKEEKERRKEKFIKKFLKDNKQFYLVEEREYCHCLLFFAPYIPYKHNIYLNKNNDEEVNKMIRNWPHAIFYLKNKNTRDWKNVSFSHIKNLSPAPKRN